MCLVNSGNHFLVYRCISCFIHAVLFISYIPIKLGHQEEVTIRERGHVGMLLPHLDLLGLLHSWALTQVILHPSLTALARHAHGAHIQGRAGETE